MLKALFETPIRVRLPLSNALIILLVTGIMGAVSYTQSAHEQKEDAEHKIEFVAHDQAARIEAWIEQNRIQLIAEAANPFTNVAIRQLRVAIASDRDGMRAVSEAYTGANPNPPGQRDALADAGDGSAYSAVHKSVHPVFQAALRTFGYYDIFLFDLDGNVIYTVAKESDFGENFATGPNAETGLGQVLAGALKAAPETVSIADFEPYAPSAGAPAAFMAAPVFDHLGLRVGAVAIQLPLDRLSALASAASMLGENGDMFIVGPDGRARTNSRFDGRFAVFDELPRVPYMQDLAAGTTGFFYGIEGITGADSLVLTLPLSFDWADWVLVAELDKSEYMAGLTRFRNSMILIAGLALIVATSLSLFGARLITRPLACFVDSMNRVAGGDYTSDVAVAGRGDEIGALGRTLVEYRDKLAAAEETEAKRERDRAAQELVTSRLGEAMKGLAEGDLTCNLDEKFPYGFEPIRANYNKTVDNLRNMLLAVVENATEIRAGADGIASSSDDLSRRTENQAATLEETVAALDEMTSSVRAAADGAAEVERVVRRARSDAEESGRVVSEAVGAMSGIKRSSDEIGQIIGVIDDIAFQTNLLALNAGVEAARAGEAGRGFAVVASEVRALAQRSAEAAKEIKGLIGASSEQVESGVNLVNRAGEALTDIARRVGEISDLVSGIAQGAQEQSVGIGEINTGMGQLDQVTQQNAAMVEEASAASLTLREEAESLRGQVARFRLEKGGAMGLGSPMAPVPLPQAS